MAPGTPARAAAVVGVVALAVVAPTGAAASDGGVQPALLLSGVGVLVSVLAFLSSRAKASRDDGAEAARVNGEMQRLRAELDALRTHVLDKLAVHSAEERRADAEARLAAERERRLALEAEVTRIRDRKTEP